MRQEESRLQRWCVQWFRLEYPHYARSLFSVPNGGSRNKLEAIRLKQEGVVAGVSDLILLVPNSQFHGLCIEMKTGKGRQSESQKLWQEETEKLGYMYIVCRSFEEFRTNISEYLSPTKDNNND